MPQATPVPGTLRLASQVPSVRIGEGDARPAHGGPCLLVWSTARLVTNDSEPHWQLGWGLLLVTGSIALATGTHHGLGPTADPLPWPPDASARRWRVDDGWLALGLLGPSATPVLPASLLASTATNRRGTNPRVATALPHPHPSAHSQGPTPSRPSSVPSQAWRSESLDGDVLRAEAALEFRRPLGLLDDKDQGVGGRALDGDGGSVHEHRAGVVNVAPRGGFDDSKATSTQNVLVMIGGEDLSGRKGLHFENVLRALHEQ